MKKWICSLLTVVMTLSLLPFTTFSEENENKIVRVKVTATAADENETIIMENGTPKTVPVEGASVNMYAPDDYKREITGSDGYAEFDLSEYTDDEISKITFSANKTIASGSGIIDKPDGGNRAPLFSLYGDDRMRLELLSMGIDDNGNYHDQQIPIGFTDQVDIAFVVDVSGSMQNTIDTVEENIQGFSEYLAGKGLDLNISVIEYNSDQNDTHIYGKDKLASELHNSPQINDVEDMKQIWSSMNASGGGTEIPIDALGFLIGNDTIHWRSGSYKFAFLLTDENEISTSNNRWGYTSIQEIADKLNIMGIQTSVATKINDSFAQTYGALYNTTGGQLFDIDAENFAEQMKKMADDVIGQAGNEVELHLQEPRLIVNMSACYYADDEYSQSDEYYNMVADRMRDYSNYVAEATDGHVLIDKVFLFNTDNRTNFYVDPNSNNTSNFPSMADIRIITKVNEDNYARIHTNANVSGFYNDNYFNWDDAEDYYQKFDTFKELLNGKKEIPRILLSGTTINENPISSSEFSKEIAHETGHYIMCFHDEYLDASWNQWSDKNPKPDNAPSNFGLMEQQADDIEMSKDTIDYSYINGNFTNMDIATSHSFQSGMSCESALAFLLENGGYPISKDALQFEKGMIEIMRDDELWAWWCTTPANESYNTKLFNIDPINSSGDEYYINYSLTTRHDKTEKYPYDECEVVDWSDGIPIEVISDNAVSARLSSSNSVLGSASASLQSLADITASETDADNIILSIDQSVGSNIRLYSRKANGLNDSTVEELTITDGHATLPLKKGQSCELIVTSENGDELLKNTYIMERSLKSEQGYYYQSNDLSVEGYVIPGAEDEYTFMTVPSSYENGDYTSVNKALRITSANDTDSQGELYSVASVNGDIDYTTVSWFKYDGNTWTKLDTDLTSEENMNIGARCDYAGEGTYVLMAKPASDEQLAPVTDIEYTNPTDRDGIVTLTFSDSNADTAYYNIYYSDNKFASKDDENVMMDKAYAGNDSYSIDLEERNKDGYVAIEAVAENGAKSPLSEVVKVNTGEADRDGDGIPDWYCDKYLLWPPSGEEKDIAGSDDDNDGLTNLEEYKGGSDPTDPDDPVKTSNVAVDSIELNKETIRVNIGRTATVTAEITPADASNKKVQWYTDDESIAAVSGDGLTCTIEGVAEGTTQITAVTEDGGFTASADVTVSRSSGGSGGGGMTALSDVEADIKEGTVTKGTQVTLSHPTNNVTIYYTTDGTTPTTGSIKYTAPITVNEDTTIKAIAVKSGYRNSSVVTFEYVVDKKPTFKLKENAAEIKYMAAYDDGSFKPDQAATRYEILEALNKLFDFENITDSASFPDVSEQYKELVNKFTCTGVIIGYEDGTFRGNNGITRAELVKILSIMFDNKDNGYGNESYSDISGHWARSYINAYAKSGYVHGYPDGTFRPDNQITRAEFVTIINNILGIDERSDTAYTGDVSSHWAHNDIAHAMK